jgi:hypothetical protein
MPNVLEIGLKLLMLVEYSLLLRHLMIEISKSILLRVGWVYSRDNRILTGNWLLKTMSHLY